eukprot:Phypoly_transcript_16551.p1 GENE.Phypoly_transcript_16551~~Phypoly_transcript_16551.p1  ORF type:complete len:209 (+),score=19.19 Phypoly_transcript_16551:171-797(+)
MEHPSETPVMSRRRASSNMLPWMHIAFGEKKKHGSFNSYLEGSAEARQSVNFLVSSDSSLPCNVEFEASYSQEEEGKGLISHASIISEAQAVLKHGIRIKTLTPRSKISVLESVDSHMSHFLQKRRILTLQHLANTTPQQVSKLSLESTAVSTVRMNKAIHDAHQLISALKKINPQPTTPKYVSPKKPTLRKQNTLDKITSFFSLPFP